MGPEEIRKHKEAILSVCERFGASNVRIFGSYARGEAGPDSDVDLLVDMESARGLFDLGGLWEALNEMMGKPVEVANPNTLHPKLKTMILEEAVPL